MIPQIKIEDYNYPLDDSRIAKYPLAERDASKLLHYKDAHVKEYSFRDLPSLLPEGAIMVFNETKVVPARMFFQRDTGAHIEIFCLEPVNPPESAGIQHYFCLNGVLQLEMRGGQSQEVEKRRPEPHKHCR